MRKTGHPFELSGKDRSLPPNGRDRAAGMWMCVHTRAWRASGVGLFASEMTLALARAGCRIIMVAPRSQSENVLQNTAGIERMRPPRERPGANRVLNAMRSISRMVAGTTLLGLARLRTRYFLISIPDPLPVALFNLAMLRLLGAQVHFVVHDPLPHAWRLPARWRWLEQGAHGLSYRLAHRIIVLSRPTATALREAFPGLRVPVDIVPHPAMFAGPPSRLPDRPRLLLFGTLRRNKNILAAITGAQRAAKAWPDLHLVIAGAPHRGEEGLVEGIESQIRQQPANVTLLVGYLDDSGLAQQIRESTAFLIPYLDFASQSGVALLAAGSGRPMIASRAGGLAELFTDGMPGIEIASPNGPDEIAAAIAAFCAQPTARWQEACDAFSARLPEERSWEAVARGLIAGFTRP